MKRLARGVTDHAIWLVVPVLGLLLFAGAWASVGFAAALVLYACRWLAVGSPVPVTRVNVPILVLLSMTAIGLVHSPAPDLGVLTAGQVVASVTLFFVGSDQIHTRVDLRHGAAALAVLGLALAVVAPFTVAWSPDKVYAIPGFYDASWPRLPKLTNPNIMAGALAPIVPVALGLMMLGERRWRVVGVVGVVPATLMLLLLQSRGALFALGVGLAIWIALYNRWFIPLIPIGLLAALYLNQSMGGPPPAQFFYGKIGTPTGGTLIERQDMWAQAVLLIRQFPLVGIGLGAYPRVAPYVSPYSPSHPGLVAPHAHNVFLQVGLDTGIPGLAAFIVLLIAALWAAWRSYWAGIERHLAIALLAALGVVIAHGFGDTIVWGTAKSSLVLWILLCLALGLDRVSAAAESPGG